MTSNLFTRVEKLESRHRTDDQVLLLWIEPGENLESAVLAANNAGLFGSGDLVMCAEWLGEDPMPKPRWLKRRGQSLSAREDEYIDKAIEKRIAVVNALAAEGKPALAQGMPHPMPRDIADISTVDLIHCIFGVST